MHTINKVQIEVNKLHDLRTKQNEWEIDELKALRQREIIRDRIFSILDTVEFLINE